MSIGRREFLGIAGLPLIGCATARADRRTTTIPLTYDDKGGLFIDVRVNGAAARLILDTGASRSTISKDFATRLGVALRKGGAVEGTAGVVTSEAAVAEVSVPDAEPFPVDFLVYSFRSYDPSVVGILGYEFLHRAPLRIDYAARQLSSGAGAPHETIPMRLDNRIPSIEVAVNGTPFRVRVDTGATLTPGPTYYVNLTQGQARAAGLTGAPVRVFTATGTGGARLELPVHDLRSLLVSGRTLGPARAIIQPPTGYFARAEAVGFLGNSVLDKLRPYLDYGTERFGVTSDPS